MEYEGIPHPRRIVLNDVRDSYVCDTIMPVRKSPSKNSVMIYHDNRPVILFVTATAKHRQPVFASPEATACIVSAWFSRQSWIVGQYMIMPDHIHFMCSPGKWPIPDFHKWMTSWKALASRSFPSLHKKPLWERNCWDVQIRTGEQYHEKWSYVLNNPIRKQLVDKPKQWPYQGVLNILEWHEA